ncbi:MAG: class I SAM-dependent methyltransferase [Spirochaetaceae bacterium]|jgi:23S rRNA (cytosine1962-C5)-methyltransferase|nr:class I SAM-dependent methyltransferase [Spirochaetaceae bacterium]
METDKVNYQAEIFANRLRKRYSHLKKWARRTGAGVFRLYDRDIPEIPLACDLYCLETGGEDISLHSPAEAAYLLMYLYQRPYEKDAADEAVWLDSMANAAAGALDIPGVRILRKVRRRQRGAAQYEKTMDPAPVTGLVREQGLRFLVDLTSHLDTGLFPDHRPLRDLVRRESAGKRVLNLFCYTGAFSVYAASGGARVVTSVDLSRTYLEKARQNMAINGFAGQRDIAFVRNDVSAFLAGAAGKGGRWDIIVLDSPTFSNSKAVEGVLDINAQWPALVRACLAVLESPGTLFFSTNSRRLKFDPAVLPRSLAVTDISGRTIPEDFSHLPHRVWRIDSRCAGDSGVWDSAPTISAERWLRVTAMSCQTAIVEKIRGEKRTTFWR